MAQQMDSMLTKKFKSRRVQCTQKSNRLQRLYFWNCKLQVIGIKMCKYFIGRNKIKVTMIVIKAKVSDLLLVILQVILMTYATILTDFMVNIISNALVMTAPGQDPAASKTLHQNHKIIIFLIFQPKRMIRKCAFIWDHRLRLNKTVSSRIITPDRQIFSKIRYASEYGQRVAYIVVF